MIDSVKTGEPRGLGEKGPHNTTPVARLPRDLRPSHLLRGPVPPQKAWTVPAGGTVRDLLHPRPGPSLTGPRLRD